MWVSGVFLLVFGDAYFVGILIAFVLLACGGWVCNCFDFCRFELFKLRLRVVRFARVCLNLLVLMV